MDCIICNNNLSFRWSDTHGVGVCYVCAMPYTIFHYENDKRVDKPPTPAVKAEFIPIARRYREETQGKVFPGAYDMGISSRRGGATYSGATANDMRKWDEWCEAHKDELPKPEEVALTGDGPSITAEFAEPPTTFCQDTPSR